MIFLEFFISYCEYGGRFLPRMQSFVPAFAETLPVLKMDAASVNEECIHFVQIRSARVKPYLLSLSCLPSFNDHLMTYAFLL